MRPATIAPTYLRCEYLVNPLAIATLQPRLSWEVMALDPTQRDLFQSAYQIRVASSAALLSRGIGDLWDSGKVRSAQSAHLVYAGTSPLPGQRCWWDVTLWDQADQMSDVSQQQWWESGLRFPHDWHAQWIGLATERLVEAADCADYPGLIASPYLRKTIMIDKSIVNARLMVAAKGLYEAHINGQRVDTAMLTPGWTDYHHRIQYQTFAVTSLLRPGENALGALLGAGWHSGYVGFQSPDLIYHAYGADVRLIMQLQITTTDGRSDIYGTDETWRATTGPIRYSDLLMGESYDARRDMPGWDTTDFDDSAWESVLAEPLGDVALVPDRAEPVVVTQTLLPQMVNEVASGVTVYDMGQNMVGWARVRLRGRAGTQVRLRFAEVCQQDGTIYTANLRSAHQTDTYIMHGDATEETFEPHFTYHGFRYVEVTGDPTRVDCLNLQGLVVHSATPPVGSFTCSNPLVNQLQHNIVWGQRGNFLSVPTDCPQRDERVGWMGDAQIFARTAAYNMDVAAFFTKWMDDVADAQSVAGAFANAAPRRSAADDGAPAWGDAGIIIPWTLYQMYGDSVILARHYVSMTRWIAYIQQENPDCIWRERRGEDFGDWLGLAQSTPKDVLATAYFAYDALLMSRIAAILNRAADAMQYHALYEQICAAFCAAFVDDEGHVHGETQTAYVLALHMRLLPETLRPLAARHLVANLARSQWHLTTGFVGVGYLCPVLTEAGYSDIAYRLLLNETFPSWNYSILHGATTIWERWDGWTETHGFQDPAMNSFNHYSLGSIGQWLYQYIAGITTDDEQPGFQHVRLVPHLDSALTYAHASYRSMHGTITSHWRWEDDVFSWNITIPANTTATIIIPCQTFAAVQEGTISAFHATGVTFVTHGESGMVFSLASGTYNFLVTSDAWCGIPAHETANSE